MAFLIRPTVFFSPRSVAQSLGVGRISDSAIRQYPMFTSCRMAFLIRPTVFFFPRSVAQSLGVGRISDSAIRPTALKT